MKKQDKNNVLDLFLGIDTPKNSWKVASNTKDSAFETLSKEPVAEKLSNHLDKHFKDWNYYSFMKPAFAVFQCTKNLFKVKSKYRGI